MQNLAGAKTVCEQLGIKQKDFYKSITSYELPHKRLQKLNNNKTKIFRDFAHSPSKLKATISAVKSQYSENLLSIYELHSSSSFNSTFLKNYKNTLTDSDYSIIYISMKNLKKFSSKMDEKIIKKIFNEDKLILISDPKKLDSFLKKNSYKDYNKLFMSSGNFDNFILDEFDNESK